MLPLTVLFSGMQICYEYASHMGPAGLMFEGFQEMYDSGHGCPDTDYTNLGYSDDPTPASIAKAKSSAREAETIDVWDPTAFPQQQGEAPADKARPAPVQELETPQVKQTNAGAVPPWSSHGTSSSIKGFCMSILASAVQKIIQLSAGSPPSSCDVGALLYMA